MKNFISLIAVSMLLTFISCSGEQSAWQDVKTSNTISGFEKFIETYPQSIFKDSAAVKIEELSYQEALNKNSLSDYETFTERFPSSIFVDSVNSKILELQLLATINSGDIPEIIGLINEYQDNQIIQDFFVIPDNILEIKSPMSIANNYTTRVRNAGDGKRILLQLTIPPNNRISSEILDFFKEGQTSEGTIVAQYTIKDNRIDGISHYESGDKGITLSIEKNSGSILPFSSGLIRIDTDLVIKISDDKFLYSSSEETKLQRIGKTDEFKLVDGSAYLIPMKL